MIKWDVHSLLPSFELDRLNSLSLSLLNFLVCTVSPSFVFVKMSSSLDFHQIKLIAYGLFRANFKATDIHNNLQDSEFKLKPKKITCYRWFNEFQNGILEFEYRRKGRSGRKPSVAIPKNILKVKRCITMDKRRTIRTVSKLTKLKFNTVRNILIKKLKMKNLGSICVPHKLAESEKVVRKQWCDSMIGKFEKNCNGYIDRICIGDESYLFFETVYMGQQRQWLFPNDEYPKQHKFNKYTRKKRMFFLCFNRKGMVHVGF